MELEKVHPPMYCLVVGTDRQGLPTFTFNYSGETGDIAFRQICMDIMIKLCEKQWVKMWIANGNNRVFVLPNGEKSLKKESFAQALQRIWKEKESVKLLFQMKKERIGFIRKKDVLQNALIFSKGVEQSILQAYFANIPPEFHICDTFLLGYQSSADGLNHYETMEEAHSRSDWQTSIYYAEMSDEMNITINSSRVDIESIERLIDEACKKYERELKIVHM